METSDVISAILAGLTFLAILVALGIGVTSICQTRNIAKTERRHRLLNEIIEWATDIAKKPYEKDFRTVLGAPDLSKVRLSVYGHIVEVKESLLALRGKSQYITEVTRKFEPDLQRAIAELVILFIGYIELLDKWQKAMARDIAMDITDRADEADAHWSELVKAAYKVIEEATKIKTRNIG